MVTITARKVDQEDYALISEAAAANGRSISEELRLMVAERARKLRVERRLTELRSIRDSLRDVPREFADSVDLIRAIRDEE